MLQLFRVLARDPRHGAPPGVVLMSRFVHKIGKWARSVFGRGRRLCSLALSGYGPLDGLSWGKSSVILLPLSAPRSCGPFLAALIVKIWWYYPIWASRIGAQVPCFRPHHTFPDPYCHRPPVHTAHPRPFPRYFFFGGVSQTLARRSLWAPPASSGGFLTPLPPAPTHGLSATCAPAERLSSSRVQRARRARAAGTWSLSSQQSPPGEGYRQRQGEVTSALPCAALLVRRRGGYDGARERALFLSSLLRSPTRLPDRRVSTAEAAP